MKQMNSPDRQQLLVKGLALIVSALIISSCGKTKDNFPQILLGKWTTESERYQDRYIEISPEMVIFGTGADSPNIFFILAYDQKMNGPENEYTIECTNTEETEFVFSFLVQEGKSDLTLRLRNPHDVIWRKVSDTTLQGE